MQPIPVNDSEFTEVVYCSQMQDKELRQLGSDIGNKIADAIDRRAIPVPAPIPKADGWQTWQKILAVILGVIGVLAAFWGVGSYVISSELRKAFEQPNKDFASMLADFKYLRRDVDGLMVNKVFAPKTSKTTALSTEEIRNTAVRAREARITVDPSIIREVAAPLLTTHNEGNWSATTALLNLRSFVNSTLDAARQKVTVNLTQAIPNTWVPIPPGEYAEINGLVILDGKDGEAGMGIYYDRPRHAMNPYQNIIFKDCHVVYRGGNVTLINVFFDNCTFEIQNDRKGVILAGRILGESVFTDANLSE